MKQKTPLLFCIALLAGITLAEMDIPEAGRIRIDGSLTDWRGAEWIPLETVISGDSISISNARWTTAWNDDGFLYIALQYEDAQLILQNGTNATDRIEIYVRGDTGSSPSDYATTQHSAQCYTIEPLADPTTARIKLGGLDRIPAHVKASAAVSLKNNTLTYEVKVPAYDTFDPTTRRKCSWAELFMSKEIGLDIAIIDIGQNGVLGILGANARNKRIDATQIAEHTLDD